MTTLKHIDVPAISSDPAARMKLMQEFVGFGDADWEALAESGAVLGPKLPGLLDALYDHLLSYDDTRRIFLGARGELDPRYLAIRKEHLTEWVLRTLSAGRDQAGFAHYLLATGKRHTGVAGEPQRVVPPRYIVGLMGFVQGALWSTLFEALPGEPERVRRYGLAWTKMLIVQLELFLKALAPHWPSWDEGAPAR